MELEIFKKKHPEFVLVKEDTKNKTNIEHFHYNGAYHLSEFNSEFFLNLMRNSYIKLDLRIHIEESGRLRNRETR